MRQAMKRAKKEFYYVGFLTEKQLKESLENYSRRVDVPMSNLCRRALKEFLEREGQGNGKEK